MGLPVLVLALVTLQDVLNALLESIVMYLAWLLQQEIAVLVIIVLDAVSIVVVPMRHIRPTEYVLSVPIAKLAPTNHSCVHLVLITQVKAIERCSIALRAILGNIVILLV